MINKLISLALLLFFLTTGYSYSEDQFLFPEKKPSVFKRIERNIVYENSMRNFHAMPNTKIPNDQKEFALLNQIERSFLELILVLSAVVVQLLWLFLHP